jgi:MFS family permease
LEDPPVSDPDLVADRPATFREVLANGEFRAVFFAGSLSTVGDSMARAAVTALVFQRTGSVLAASATFAISYLPWIGLGSLLAAVAERYPYRRTMVVCDVARMVTIGLVAVPRMPLYVLLGLLFLTALFDPPFRAARSALNPRILSGDRYVLSLSLIETVTQIALVTGYLLGGTIAAYNARVAVGFDAVTFGVSALIVGLCVRPREPALRPDRRTRLLRETAEGFEVVFGSRVLRSIAIVIFASLLFAVVPEGLGAAWAGHLTDNRHDRGWMQGVIMCSTPLGFVVGSVIINRFIRPSVRLRLIRPLAIMTPLALVAALLDPPVYGVAAIAAVSGFAVAGLLPASNGLFVQALPTEVRARAFGVMMSGVQLSQGGAVFLTGLLASHISLPVVVGFWGVGGVMLMVLAGVTWPRPEAVAAKIDQVRRINAEEPPPTDRQPTRPGGAHRPSPGIRPTPPAGADAGLTRSDDHLPQPGPSGRSGGGRHRLGAASR